MSGFNISDDTMVITTRFVTEQGLPILLVSHEDDEEGGSLWQFHCGNDDYSKNKLLLVRLDTLLKVDPSIVGIAALPMGSEARRQSREASWVISP